MKYSCTRLRQAGRLLNAKRRERAAASSLLLVILVPVILLILAIYFEGAGLRRDEFEFARLCEQRLNWIMADYDRDLWRDFGLWGVNVNLLADPKYERLERELIPPQHEFQIKLEMMSELSDPDHLKAQILRQMSLRGPYLLGQEIVQRLHEIRSANSESLSETWSSLVQTKNYMDPETLIGELPAEVLDSPSQAEPVSPDEGFGDPDNPGYDLPNINRNVRADHTEEELNLAKEAALNLAEERITACKEALVPLYQSAGSDVTERVLAPGVIGTLADFADHLLFAYDLPIVSHLQLQEYILNYFTSAVQGRIHAGQGIAYLTPDGRKMSDLAAGGRRNEVESILFPRKSGERSAKAVKNRIMAIFFISRLIRNARSKTKQAIYLVEATALSGAIAAASLGQVLIKPSYLKYLIMLVDSVQAAHRDVKKSLAGHAVAIGIAEEGKSISLYYRDFLRLFSLLTSERQLLVNLDRVRQRVIAGRFACSIKLDAVFRGHHLNMKREYASYLP